MLLRPLACRHAAHRTSTEALWITDKILASTFIKFCAITRRHGSNVPGPMECRRKSGRRRIAYMTQLERTEQKLPDWISLTGLRDGFRHALGWKQPDDYEYEPPRQKVQDPEVEVKLPAWLTEWKLSPTAELLDPEPEVKLPEWLMDYNPLSPEEVLEKKVDSVPAELKKEESIQTGLAHDLKEFGRRIAPSEYSNKAKMHRHFFAFNRNVKRRLRLGQMSDDDLGLCLQDATRYMRVGISSADTLSNFCMLLYKTVWEGIASSEVLGPRSFDSWVLNELLILISQIQHDFEVERLTTRILAMVSEHQLLHMHDGILAVTRGWVSSWVIELTADKSKLYYDIEASIMALANALNYLPHNRALDILTQITIDFSSDETCNEIAKIAAFRYVWMTLISHVKGVGEQLFGDIWAAVDEIVGTKLKELEAQNIVVHGVSKHLDVSQCCDVILNHWISSDLVNNPSAVRNTLYILMLTRDPIQSLSCLIASIDRHAQIGWAKITYLTRILRRLGFYSAVDETFKNLPGLGVKFPANIMAAQIKWMAPIDFNIALSIYKTYPKVRLNYICLTTVIDRYHPDFYLHMIRSEMYPTDIWRLLRIPLHRKIWQRPFYSGRSRRHKKLRVERIILICDMALEFAHAKYLRPRQARRNIEQCLLYLRKHGTSLRGKTVLSRALVHAVVTRETVKGKWVGTSTLRWVVKCVEMAEGAGARDRLVGAVLRWRSEVVEGQRRRVSDANSAKAWECY